MSGLPGRKVRNVLLVDRVALINRLRSIAASEDSVFEAERRARFAERLDALRRERIDRPRVLVEAPVSVVNSRVL
jgi:hypothetical protein